MTPGPRRLPRGRGNTNALNDATNSLSRTTPVDPSIAHPILPKHFPLPNMQQSGDIFYEIIIAFFTIIGTGLQFLHLYRTVWWLPNSYNHSTMNFYLIDPNLVIFIIFITLRRLYYQIGCKLILKLYSNKSEEDLSSLSRGILSIFFAFVMGTLGSIVVGNLGKSYMLYLAYPVVVYLILFGFQIRPFFEFSSWCSNDLPLIHACSSNPNDVRKECEHLRNFSFGRFKQCIFTAIMNCYYAGWIPCAFVPSELIFDLQWCILHGFNMFSSSLIFSFTHFFPLKYFDTMHRAVLHLGVWEKVDQGKNSMVSHEWRDDVIWPGGIFVKYEKSVWKALGDCNSVRPDDKVLSRYYNIFISPSRVLKLVFIYQFAITGLQMYALVRLEHWFKILSMAIMMFFNLYPLYKVLRDFLVCRSIYNQSSESYEKKVSEIDAKEGKQVDRKIKKSKEEINDRDLNQEYIEDVS